MIELIPEVGDASLVGSGDTGGDCDRSDVNISVSGDTAGEGVKAPSSSKATGFFLCFVFFRFPSFFPVILGNCHEQHRHKKRICHLPCFAIILASTLESRIQSMFINSQKIKITAKCILHIV